MNRDYNKQPVDWLGLICLVAAVALLIDMVHIILMEANLVH